MSVASVSSHGLPVSEPETVSKPSSHAARTSGSPGGQVASARPAVTVPPSARSRPVSSARFHRRFSAGTSAAVRGFSGGAITAAATGMSGLRSTCRGVSGRGPDSAIHLLSATPGSRRGSRARVRRHLRARRRPRNDLIGVRRGASSASRIPPGHGRHQRIAGANELAAAGSTREASGHRQDIQHRSNAYRRRHKAQATCRTLLLGQYRRCREIPGRGELLARLPVERTLPRCHLP